MKISQKLILGFVGVASLTLVVGAVSISGNKRLQSIAEEDVYKSISHLGDIWQLMEAQEHQEIAANNYIFLDEGLEGKRADYFYEKERLGKIYDKYSKESCEHVKPLLEKYYKNIKVYHTKIEGAFELHRQGVDSELIKEKVREANEYAESAHEGALEPLIEHVLDKHIEPAKTSIAKGIGKTTRTTVVISVVAVLSAIGSGVFISRSIYVPLAKLRDAASEIGKGDLNVRIDINSNDEIGQLSRAFDKMTEDLKQTTTSIDNLNQEIVKRKKTEGALGLSNKNLEDSNKKLNQSNQQLQEFIYVASHDLREPVRKVSSFGQLLTKALAGKLNDDEQENFDYMIAGANRMQEMIEALLTYSRATNKDIEFEEIDLNEIVEQIRSFELVVRLEETGGCISVPEPLPIVKGDPAQIRQLLQNFIGNALKYYKKEVVPEVTIRAHSQENGMVRIEVEDNGIGIKAEQCENVFVMFKRLYSRQEYDGTGIGLAVCKRIVERHKGEIGVSSTYGQGSTFWFQLPVLQTSDKRQMELISSCET